MRFSEHFQVGVFKQLGLPFIIDLLKLHEAKIEKTGLEKTTGNPDFNLILVKGETFVNPLKTTGFSKSRCRQNNYLSGVDLISRVRFKKII